MKWETMGSKLVKKVITLPHRKQNKAGEKHNLGCDQILTMLFKN